MEKYGFEPRVQNDPNRGNRPHAMVATGQELEAAGLNLEETRTKYRLLTMGTFGYSIVGFDSFLVR